MANYYPPVGFHFKVEFEGISADGADTRFQNISGINASVPNSETYQEGGENRFTHRLPQRASYENLVLKRGMLLNSNLIDWFRDALEYFKFSPRDITVTLMNAEHFPLEQWMFYKAWPTKWNTEGFDAEKSGLIIETVEFSYQYFERKAISKTTLT
ncbi:MAG: phage tail protein [Bacteroidia bacterium]|nr:phage tail protein [Bacteroidia bacterium]